MEITAHRQTLAKAIINASKFVSPRAQLPILGNIVLSAQKSTLTIKSTNLEISYATQLTAAINKEGEIAVPGKIIAELIPNLIGENITISVTNESMEVSAEGFSSKIAAINTHDFPEIPLSLSTPFLMPQTFKKALGKVLFASGSDPARPILMGVMFVSNNEILSLVASDGFRLSKYEIELPVKTDLKIVIPKTILTEIVKSDGGSISFEKKDSESQVLFESNGTVWGSRLIEGNFPNYERIIPKNHRVKVSVSRDDLIRAIKLAAVFARDSGNIVTFSVSDNQMTISSQSQKNGVEKMSIAASVEGGETTISFNYKFVEEFLQNIESDSVTIKLNDERSAGVFEDPMDTSFLHLIMPTNN